MEKVKTIAKFAGKMFEISLPLLMFGFAFHSHYCGEAWAETLRWIWTGVIIIILYWFSWSSNNLIKQFANHMEQIVSRQWSMIDTQDRVIKLQEGTITVLKKELESVKGYNRPEQETHGDSKKL